MKTYNWEGVNPDGYFLDRKSGSAGMPRSEERFSRNAETDLVCRLLLEKKKKIKRPRQHAMHQPPPRQKNAPLNLPSYEADKLQRTEDIASSPPGHTAADK